MEYQAVLDNARESYGAPGALAISRNGGAEWSAVSGVADLTGTGLTDASRFRIASITKPIVALLVLDSVSRGEVSLDDTVGDFVPDVLRPDPPVSVRMLLDHTSGIFNVGDESDLRADIAALTDAELKREATDLATRYLAGEHVSMPDRLYVALAETHERYFEPGAGYHYSNVNYQLAAMVLNLVTGMPLAELLRTRLVGPLGLRHTTIAPDDTGTPEMHGYITNSDGTMVDMTDDFLALGNGGSGGVISTAGELLTTMQAIVSGELLAEPLVTDMRTATTQSHDQYGLGLATYNLSCGTFYGHAGAVNGIHTIALVNDDGAVGVVIAFNLSSDVDPNLLALDRRRRVDRVALRGVRGHARRCPAGRRWPRCRRRTFDLIVLDVMLPDVDGFEVAGRLRADGIDTPISVPHRPHRARGQGAGVRSRCRRLRDQALLACRDRDARARHPAPFRSASPGATPGDELRFADVVMDTDAHQVWRGGVDDPADGDRVPAVAVLPDESWPGRVEVANPRSRVALRLRRRLERARDLRQLPAPQAERARPAADPHRPARRLRAARRSGPDVSLRTPPAARGAGRVARRAGDRRACSPTRWSPAPAGPGRPGTRTSASADRASRRRRPIERERLRIRDAAPGFYVELRDAGRRERAGDAACSVR